MRIAIAMSAALHFAGAEFVVAGEAALFWPRHDALLVADLHLEKASSYAAGGQMLPPYDSRATLERIGALAAQTGMIGPLSTITMGVLILGEPFTAWVAAGTLLVLAGIWLLAKWR